MKIDEIIALQAPNNKEKSYNWKTDKFIERKKFVKEMYGIEV